MGVAVYNSKRTKLVVLMWVCVANLAISLLRAFKNAEALYEVQVSDTTGA